MQVIYYSRNMNSGQAIDHSPGHFLFLIWTCSSVLANFVKSVVQTSVLLSKSYILTPGTSMKEKQQGRILFNNRTA